ncbi:excisionase family DNA-binding protein [Actibacterium sp. MT2.3-13A]|uniref:excisionase family DNA-binding protein n=1 Tax=Actibacterium sp. MT2.3-13A TaxID=2828332 RepID=UPI0032C22145
MSISSKIGCGCDVQRTTGKHIYCLSFVVFQMLKNFHRSSSASELLVAITQVGDQKGVLDLSPRYTPKTLAERWSCSSETVRQLCKSGQLESFRVGRQFRIPAHKVEEYEQRRNTASAASMVASSLSGMRKIDADAGIVLKRTLLNAPKPKSVMSSLPRHPQRMN